MQKFLLPSSNIFEDKATDFQKSKLATRLKKKYTPKPFEERFKEVFSLSLLTSYLCNLFSILTASTYLFTYIYGVVKALPYSIPIAVLLTGAILLVVEALLRFLAPQFFRGILQYGFKTNSTVLLLFIGSLCAISIFFSYSGGFTVMEFREAPTYSAPTLIQIDQIKAEYRGLIKEADREAQDFKERRLYRGKLSRASAKVYKNLLDKKTTLQEAMIAKINSSEALNRKDKAEAQEDYKTSLSDYKSANLSKGGGLAKFTIIAQLIFLLSIWFMELYDYKTASQYAIFDGSADPPKSKAIPPSPPTPGKQRKAYSLNSSGIVNTVNSKELTKVNTTVNREPIGYKTAEKTPLKQIVTTKTVLGDKHTIEHNGKRYSLKEVKNFESIYKRRVAEAQKKGNTDLVSSRGETLTYWRDKKRQLLDKINS